MTQEKILKQAVKEQSQLYQPPEWRAGFVSGAKWADETMIKKAKEWLEKTLYIHTELLEDKHLDETKPSNWVTSDYDSVEDFINGFCKAMEE